MALGARAGTTRLANKLSEPSRIASVERKKLAVETPAETAVLLLVVSLMTMEEPTAAEDGLLRRDTVKSGRVTLSFRDFLFLSLVSATRLSASATAIKKYLPSAVPGRV